MNSITKPTKAEPSAVVNSEAKVQAFIAAYSATYAVCVGASDAASYADHHFKRSADFHISVHHDAMAAGRWAVCALNDARAEGLFGLEVEL